MHILRNEQGIEFGRPPVHSQRGDRAKNAKMRLAILGVAVALLTTGCNETVARGWMPEGATEHTDRITNLWVGSWIAALIVGVLVWGLVIWCIIVYRKRKGDEQLPVQLRYHIPLEILYTAVPVLAISVLFYFTARDQNVITAVDRDPDVIINVVGKQWSWDFNYVTDDVWDAGIHGYLDEGIDGTEAELPTLYLPVDELVEFRLDSRDVIHSFWIPAFLYKLDMFPNHTNTFQVTPTKVGQYAGKCAELCGDYHSAMLFNVEIVERDVYDAQMQKLREAGQDGQLGPEMNRLQSNEQIWRTKMEQGE